MQLLLFILFNSYVCVEVCVCVLDVSYQLKCCSFEFVSNIKSEREECKSQKKVSEREGSNQRLYTTPKNSQNVTNERANSWSESRAVSRERKSETRNPGEHRWRVFISERAKEAVRERLTLYECLYCTLHVCVHVRFGQKWKKLVRLLIICLIKQKPITKNGNQLLPRVCYIFSCRTRLTLRIGKQVQYWVRLTAYTVRLSKNHQLMAHSHIFLLIFSFSFSQPDAKMV